MFFFSSKCSKPQSVSLFYRMGNQVPLMKRDDQIMNSLARESANPIIERQLVTFYDEEETN